jgi:hypothetical protein
MTLWRRLYSQMTAIEAIGVCREGPRLNSRAQMLLNYLRRRRRRVQ